MTDFHELHTRYAGDIYRFTLFLCGDAAEAEDITAETFARALLGKASLVSATVKVHRLRLKLAEWRADREKIEIKT